MGGQMAADDVPRQPSADRAGQQSSADRAAQQSSADRATQQSSADRAAHLAPDIALSLTESLEIKQRLLEEGVTTLAAVAERWLAALTAGHKILLFGNGGSAADAQHIAGELVGRFYRERRALPAIALTTDTSILTAIGNDYGFEHVFARQVAALGRPGDVAVGLSTSGRSPNVVRGLALARAQGLATVAFTGADGGVLAGAVDLCFQAPSSATPRIQEAHLAAAHAICQAVEQAFVAVEGGGLGDSGMDQGNGDTSRPASGTDHPGGDTAQGAGKP